MEKRTMEKGAGARAARATAGGRSSARPGGRALGRAALLGALLAACAAGEAAGAEGPLGWASVEAEGQKGTPGGAGGKVVTVATAAELDQHARSAGPTVIRVQGTIRFKELRPASDKTIEGAAPGATLVGALTFAGKEGAPLRNLVLRNLVIRNDEGGGQDAIGIRFAHHVWIDHCDVSDSPDGLIDMTHAADYVTVSWTRLHYTDPKASHRFAMLLGHSDDNASEDAGRLRVTLHHNWWADNVVERMPRIRFGKVHVFNNYFASGGNNYGVGAGIQAQARVENNVFDGVKDPHVFYDGEATARIAASGNLYLGVSATTKRDAGQGEVFAPPYAVALDPAERVKTLVTEGAGPFRGQGPSVLAPRLAAPEGPRRASPGPTRDAAGRRRKAGEGAVRLLGEPRAPRP